MAHHFDHIVASLRFESHQDSAPDFMQLFAADAVKADKEAQ
jgi:hypothetical protein